MRAMWGGGRKRISAPQTLFFVTIFQEEGCEYSSADKGKKEKVGGMEEGHLLVSRSFFSLFLFLVLAYFSCPADRNSRQLSRTTEQRAISRWASERASRVYRGVNEKWIPIPWGGGGDEEREEWEVYRPGIGSQLRHITHFTLVFSFHSFYYGLVGQSVVGHDFLNFGCIVWVMVWVKH